MLSQEQAQWLVTFMQNLPGGELEYMDAAEAQRAQAARGMNVQDAQLVGVDNEQNEQFYEDARFYEDSGQGY